MKTRLALVIGSLSFLAACGEDMNFFQDAGVDAGPSYYAFAAGTYGVSNAVLSSASDECGLLAAYQDPAKKIGIAQSGAVLTFNLANDPAAPANSLPSAVLNGNSIEQPTEANYTAAFGSTCVVRIKRTVTGSVVNHYAAALTLSFSASTEAGCTTNTSPFAALPCASAYQFTATRE
jgi:hypothetical protein